MTAPPGLGTRPILDRVKVALFDKLGSRLAQPGSLPPLAVLDIFCGGGSLGIEALSRGAAFCTFIDADRAAVRCLRANLDALDIGPAARVVSGHVETVHIAPPPDNAFGLIFLDPPYSMSEDVTPDSVMGRVIARLGGDIPVEPDAVVVWRHHADCVLPEVLPGGWTSLHRPTWGKMAVTMLQREPRE